MSCSLTLYFRPGCHLCEDAREMIQQMDGNIPFEEIDITNNSRLESDYGWSIPVLRNMTNESEISWPFGPQDVLNLISE